MAKQNPTLDTLSSDQMGNLRQMLQDFTSGTSTKQLEEDPECCHSSHFDNDGWF